MNEVDIQALDLAGLAELHMATNEKLDELKALKEEITAAMDEKMQFDSEKAGNYAISRVRRLTFGQVTLEEAEKYGATKKVVDQTMLGDLHKSGTPIEGAKEITYFTVKNIEGNTKTRTYK